MTNLMTILERKAFISSNPRIVLSSCPPPCGHFSIQESASGGLSYKVKNQKVYINGKRLQTDIYGKEPIEDAGTAANLMVLGKNEYFVLGDNRNDSDDSRFPEVGVIKKNRIIGKTSFRLLPIKNIGKLN